MKSEPFVVLPTYNNTAKALAPLSNETIVEAIAKFSTAEQRKITELIIAIRKQHLEQERTHTENVVLALREKLIKDTTCRARAYPY